GVAAVDDRLGRTQGAAPLDPPAPLADPLHPSPERLHGPACGQDVVALQQTLDFGHALGHAAEDQGAVRHRLVARCANHAPKAGLEAGNAGRGEGLGSAHPDAGSECQEGRAGAEKKAFDSGPRRWQGSRPISDFSLKPAEGLITWPIPNWAKSRSARTARPNSTI